VSWTALVLFTASVCLPSAAGAQPSDAASDASSSPPPAILLAPGQVQTLNVSDVARVAVGDPAVADVTIVSQSQILVQAKQIGSTNLIIWDAQGQRQTTLRVIDPQPEAISAELRSLLVQLNKPSVHVLLQEGKVFLTGEVASEAELNTLEQIASAFRGMVINLVTVTPAGPAQEETAPLVRLSVQVVEINRSDLEKLGIKWSETLALTQPEVTSGFTVNDALFRWGTSLSRSSLTTTLNALVKQSKGRVLSEPKLVTASGKEASSFIGVEVPVIKATSFGSETASVSASIEFRQTGVLLKMTPTVHGSAQDAKITTVMQAEVSGLDKTVGLDVPVGTKTILVPGFKVRKANTEVTTVSGETIVIAGLLEAEDTNDMSQVPGLGNIPVVGRLFRSPEVSATQRELVIAVTPELVEDEAQTADRQLALEQALAVAEVTASVDDPRLRYALTIQDRIAKVLRYPQREKELNIEGTVKLKLHLFADGTLGRATVSESSGVESLDLEAVKAAESQSPYPGFPSQLTERELWLEVPIIFRP